MPFLPPLRSRDNPRVRAVSRLRRQRERRRQGRFVADGIRQVERAVRAGLRLREGFVCRAVLRPEHDVLLVGLIDETPGGSWFELPEALMDHIAYRRGAQSIVGVFDLPAWAIEGGSDQMLGPGMREGPELWLVAVGIEKPGNLGAMVRTADAAGAWGVWAADAVVDAFHPNAIEASSGSVFTLPVSAGSSEDALAFMAARQVRVFAGVPDAELSHARADMAGPTAIAIGAEDRGLGPDWLARSPGAAPHVQRVSIAMRGRTSDSLNAAASAAVLLFEAVRQREAAEQ